MKLVTYMQFLAARSSLCTNLCSVRYSIPFAIWSHMSIILFCVLQTCVCVHIRKSRGVERRAGSFKLWLHHWQCEEGKSLKLWLCTVAMIFTGSINHDRITATQFTWISISKLRYSLLGRPFGCVSGTQPLLNIASFQLEAGKAWEWGNLDK